MKKRYFKSLNADISPLGYGLMRLPMNQNNWFEDSVFDLIDYAMGKGINYYDTGFYYLNEKSEELIREALVKRYKRDTFYIADKLPVWDCKTREDMDRIFNIQLERLGVEYIDFYLLHALHRQRWEDINSIGVLEFLKEKKREGRIKRVGFSIHDSAHNMKNIVESFEWDFAQIQLNYYDWKVLHTEDNYRLLEEKGIPCITMESVGGGRLSILPKEAEDVYKNIHQDWSPSAWAVRFVESLPNVAVVLSGMNAKEQIEDNCNACSGIHNLSELERKAINTVVDILSSKDAIPCTACRYCTTECPKKIDIPQVFKAYNDYKIFGEGNFFDISYNLLAGYPRAEDCIACGKCRSKCPQCINIPEKMIEVRKMAFEREFSLNKDKVHEVDFANSTIISFGCGDYGRRVIKFLGFNKCKGMIFTDNNKNLWETEFEGYRVVAPNQITQILALGKAKIIIATLKYKNDIYKQLIEMGINTDDILNV